MLINACHILNAMKVKLDDLETESFANNPNADCVERYGVSTGECCAATGANF